MTNHWIAISLAVYIALQMGIAVFVSRSVKTEDDYVVAGRNLGVFLTAVSLFATWFGAETVMASAGAIAAQGLAGGRADPFGYSMCLILMGLLIATRMRRGAYLTSGDFYRARFNAPTEKLAVAVQVLTSLVWAAAQVLAFGHILAAIIGISLTTAILICVVIVTIYTMLGGLLGDVITDVVQGFILVLGLLATLFFIVGHMGGWAQAFSTISAAQLHLFTDQESYGAQIDEWAIAILGSLTAQEALSRILATKSSEVARKGAFSAAALYLLAGLIPVAIGLLGASVLPVNEGNSDGYLPQLAQMMLPVPVFVIFLGALVSAILSTIDSTVLSISALITHNIIEPLYPGLGENLRLRLQRVMTVVTGIVVYFIAISGDSIYGLVEQASSFGAAGLLVVMVAGLWLRWGGPWTGFATVAAGIGLTFLTRNVLEMDMAFLASLAGCVLVYAAFGVIEWRSNFGKRIHA